MRTGRATGKSTGVRHLPASAAKNWPSPKKTAGPVKTRPCNFTAQAGDGHGYWRSRQKFGNKKGLLEPAGKGRRVKVNGSLH